MESDDDERLSKGSNSPHNDQMNNTIETTAKSMEEEVPAIVMENSVEDAQKSTEEECPKILHPAFSDIFPLFANMLDIKSFMTLARASKEMHSKCMDDNRIKLNVKEEQRVTVRMVNGAPQLAFRCYFGRRNINSYIANLHRLKFDISLSYVRFERSSVCMRVNFDSQAVIATRKYFKEIGVKSIDRLELDSNFNGREGIVPFMEEFNVKHASIGPTIPEDSVNSILQLNMVSFNYSGEISANTLLNVSSPIPKMEFSDMEEMTNDVFTQILWKIQTGPLENLTLNWSAVDMSSFDTVPYDFDGVLPEERPLVFSQEDYGQRSYWFLHWHGGVTKCIGEGFAEEYYERHPWRHRRDPYHDGYDDDDFDEDDYDEDDYHRDPYYEDYDEENDDEKTIKITKCDPSDYPPVIRPKELVFKELDEKLDRVVCSSVNFHSYFEGKDMLDPLSTSPLPEERPLLCKGARNSYWNFKEDGILEQFQLVNLKVHYDAYDTNNRHYPSECDNVALAKYIFQRRMKENVHGHVECSKEQFNSWLEEYKTLPYDHLAPLPEDRPLIFAKTENIERYNKQGERRAILLEDGTVTNCSFCLGECRLERFVPWELPSCLISVKDFKDIVKNAPVDCNFVHPQHVITFKYSLGLETFLAGFEDFNTLSWEHDGPLPDDRPLVFMKREENGDELSEQRWLLNKDCLVMECEWKNGEVTIRKGYPKKFPRALTKGLVKEFLQGKWRNVDFVKKLHGFFLDFAMVRGCLEEFKTVPYAHSGPLLEDRPLIFEKSATKHVCKGSHRNCNCTGVVLQFWSLCEGDIIVPGSWNEKGAQKMVFPNVNVNDIPPVLKSRNYLKYLMEKKWNVKKGWTMRWYGEKRDYLAYFSAPRLTKLRTNHHDPLPKIRPLVVSGPHKRWFLRADGALLHCHWKNSYAEICVSPTHDVPHCMRHLS